MDGVGHGMILSRSAQEYCHCSGAQPVGRIVKHTHHGEVRLNAIQDRSQSMSLASAGYEVQVSRGIDDAEWDAFLAVTPGGSYPQTTLWARTKAIGGFRAIRIVI